MPSATTAPPSSAATLIRPAGSELLLVLRAVKTPVLLLLLVMGGLLRRWRLLNRCRLPVAAIPFLSGLGLGLGADRLCGRGGGFGRAPSRGLALR